MREPYEIASGWYFEGNMSLDDKHAIIKDDLPRSALSQLHLYRAHRILLRANP